MKKNLFLLSITFIALFALTGCGSKDKQLTCSVTSDEAKFLMIGDSQKAVMTFKDDKVNSVSTELIIKAESKEQAEEYKEEFNQLLSISSTDLVPEIKIDGTNLVVTQKVDVSQMSEEDKEDAFGEETSYDGLKKYYEEQGYTCQ